MLFIAINRLITQVIANASIFSSRSQPNDAFVKGLIDSYL